MAKKKQTQPVKVKKMSKEEREHIDNQVVLATAIALVSALFLLYLNNYLNSAYASATRTFIKVLFWMFDAAVAVFVGLYIWKKDKKFLRILAYCVGGALMMSIILYLPGLLYTTGISTMLHIFDTTKLAFILIYVCLGIYLVATYIYYGMKIVKAK